jgi:hypothetical protein
MPELPNFVAQTIQIVGAILILIAYVAAQFKYMSPHSVSYLLANLVGSVTLAALALIDSQWGFLLMETVWALVSGVNLARLIWGKRVTGV